MLRLSSSAQVAFALAALVAVASPARANVPAHGKPTSIKGVGKAGSATGVKLTLRLTTTDSQRFPKAHVALVDPAKTAQLTRGQAAHFDRGMLLHQFAAIDGIVA